MTMFLITSQERTLHHGNTRKRVEIRALARIRLRKHEPSTSDSDGGNERGSGIREGVRS